MAGHTRSDSPRTELQLYTPHPKRLMNQARPRAATLDHNTRARARLPKSPVPRLAPITQKRAHARKASDRAPELAPHAIDVMCKAAARSPRGCAAGYGAGRRRSPPKHSMHVPSGREIKGSFRARTGPSKFTQHANRRAIKGFFHTKFTSAQALQRSSSPRKITQQRTLFIQSSPGPQLQSSTAGLWHQLRAFAISWRFISAPEAGPRSAVAQSFE